jgi:hypothetical protein
MIGEINLIQIFDNLDNLVWCCYWWNNNKSNFFIEEEFKPIGNVNGIALKQIIEKLQTSK